LFSASGAGNDGRMKRLLTILLPLDLFFIYPSVSEEEFSGTDHPDDRFDDSGEKSFGEMSS
jgi:hypothetical protein